jgi:hypothetical protein
MALSLQCARVHEARDAILPHHAFRLVKTGAQGCASRHGNARASARKTNARLREGRGHGGGL